MSTGVVVLYTLAGATVKLTVDRRKREGGVTEGKGSDGDYKTLVQQSPGAACTRRETADQEGRHFSP